MAYTKTYWGTVQIKDVRRLQWFGAFIFSLIMVVLFRIFVFQVWKREPWNEQAQKQYQQLVKLIAERGIIYDRNMQILAMDASVFSVAANPKKVDDVGYVSKFLASILGDTPDQYKKLLSKHANSSFVWIQKELTEKQKQALLDKHVTGLIPIQGRKRVHPFDKLGWQVLGITNSKHEGVGGIEQALDKTLSGTDGWVVYQKDGKNRNYISLDYPFQGSQNGDHIVLTLDQVFQTVVEEELRFGVEQHRAKSGCAVLMDPFTGEILSMSSVVSVDRKKQDIAFNVTLMNRPVQLDFEPGSTFKIVTAAAALEKKILNANSLIHCENGDYKIAGHVIHDHNNAHELLTLRQIVEYSSNIGIAKIGKKLGKKNFYKTIQNFGFGNKTGIGLPGEVAGILRPIYTWSDFSTATIAFGQGISVSALQLSNMISAVANGGLLMKPWIVRAIQDNAGNVKKACHSEVIRRVISEETAAELREILEGVILNGNGSEAAVEGVRVAGKTGTAQKSAPGFNGYIPGAYVSSFVGFWPVETPRYVLVIILDEPRYLYWGSRSAAPVFANVVRRIEGLPLSHWVQQQDETNGMHESRYIFSSLEIEKTEQLVDPKKPESIDISPYHVPNLIGLSLREALHRLAIVEMEARVQGNGIVLSQTPQPGARIQENMVCKLRCQTR